MEPEGEHLQAPVAEFPRQQALGRESSTVDDWGHEINQSIVVMQLHFISKC